MCWWFWLLELYLSQFDWYELVFPLWSHMLETVAEHLRQWHLWVKTGGMWCKPQTANLAIAAKLILTICIYMYTYISKANHFSFFKASPRPAFTNLHFTSIHLIYFLFSSHSFQLLSKCIFHLYVIHISSLLRVNMRMRWRKRGRNKGTKTERTEQQYLPLKSRVAFKYRCFHSSLLYIAFCWNYLFHAQWSHPERPLSRHQHEKVRKPECEGFW